MIIFFYGHNLSTLLKRSVERIEHIGGAVVFGYYVRDPQRYGVVEFDKDENVLSIEEKPKEPKSNYAVVGLYFYDNSVVQIAKDVKPHGEGSWRLLQLIKPTLSKGSCQLNSWDVGMHGWILAQLIASWRQVDLLKF